MIENLSKIFARLSNGVSSYLAPALFIFLGETTYYGEILSTYALLQLTCGWIFNAFKKAFLYSDAHSNEHQRSLPFLGSLILISILAYLIGHFFGISAKLYALGICYLVLETYTVGYLEQQHLISLSIITKACGLVLPSIAVALVAKFLSLTPFPVYAFLASCFSLLLLLICTLGFEKVISFNLFEIGGFTNRVSTFYAHSLRLLPVEAEMTFVSQLPIFLVSQRLGVDNVTFFKLIQSIVKIPAFYQGYTNPYYASALRKLTFHSSNFLGSVLSLFKKQTFINTCVGSGIFILFTIVLLIHCLIEIPRLSVYFDGIYAFRYSVLIGLACYLLIVACGPVTNTLLGLRQTKLLGKISSLSSVIGISAMLIASTNISMDTAILVSLVPATVSNVFSRVAIERIFAGAVNS